MKKIQAFVYNLSLADIQAIKKAVEEKTSLKFQSLFLLFSLILVSSTSYSQTGSRVTQDTQTEEERRLMDEYHQKTDDFYELQKGLGNTLRVMFNRDDEESIRKSITANQEIIDRVNSQPRLFSLCEEINSNLKARGVYRHDQCDGVRRIIKEAQDMINAAHEAIEALRDNSVETDESNNEYVLQGYNATRTTGNTSGTPGYGSGTSQNNGKYVITEENLERALKNQASPGEAQRSREYSDMMVKKVEKNIEQAQYKNEVRNVAGSQLLSGDVTGAVSTYAQAGMTTEALTVAGIDLAFKVFGEIIRSSSQKKAEKAASAALIRSQEQALEHIQKINKNVLTKYLELQKIPLYTYYDEHILEELLAYEEKLKDYELATAGERLLLLTYHAADERMTTSQLETTIENVRKLGQEQGVEAAVQQIELLQERFNIQEIPHLGNMGEGFSSLLGKINLYKARCYEAMGQRTKAAALRGNIIYIASPDDAIKLVPETYRDRNYLATSRYAEVLQDHLLNVVPQNIFYEDLNNLSSNFKGLYRSEATYLLALGILAEIKTGQILKARESLTALMKYHELMDSLYQNYLKKKDREKIHLSDKEFADMVHVSSSIISAVTAYFEVKNENKERGWKKFNDAMALYGSVPSIPDKFQIWFDSLELEILVEMERYEEARNSLAELKSSLRRGISATYAIPIDKEDIDFNNAYIRYKTKDYKGALFALKIMEQKNGSDLRMYFLSEQIYREMGDVTKAEDSKEKYLSLLTSEN